MAIKLIEMDWMESGNYVEQPKREWQAQSYH
jgi:hypothetical protein